jgi:hypothetical protein
MAILKKHEGQGEWSETPPPFILSLRAFDLDLDDLAWTDWFAGKHVLTYKFDRSTAAQHGD